MSLLMVFLIWVLFLSVGAIDALYFHTFRLKLHHDQHARAEHGVHALRALVIAPIMVFGFVVPAPRVLVALFIVDVTLMVIDVALEKSARAPHNGLSHGEYSTHIAATFLHGAGWMALGVALMGAPVMAPVAVSVAASGIAVLSTVFAGVSVAMMVRADTYRRGFDAAVALLCLSRPRTWAFATLAFLAAAMPGGASVGQMMSGVVVCFALTAFANIFNIWTDRREDAVNLPLRAGMVAKIGTSGLLVTCVGLVALALALGAAHGAAYFGLVALGAALGFLYSAGLRLKAHAFFSLLTFGGIVTSAYVSGCALTGVVPPDAGALLAVMGASFFAYGTLKNFPDIRGDRAAGVRTLFTIFSTTRAVRFSVMLLLVPYVVLVGLVATGALRFETLIALNGLFVVAALAYRMFTDRSGADRECSHAFGFYYELGFLALLFSAHAASWSVAAASAAIFYAAALADHARIDSRPYELSLSRLCGRKKKTALERAGVFRRIPQMKHDVALR